MCYNEFTGIYGANVAMQFGPLHRIVLKKSEEEVTLECQMGYLDMQILSGWVLMGGSTVLTGLVQLSGLAHLAHNAPRGVGIMPLIFGCFALGTSWYKARTASTVTFNLKQKLVTITPMWHLGRKQTYRFDEIQALQAIKHFINPHCYVQRQWWYDYWRFSFTLTNAKKIIFFEGYPPRRDDKYIQMYIETIGSSTGITSR
jgi:hypothetical protein